MEDKETLSFGEILDKLLKSKEVSRAELAEKLEVSQMAISKLINNKNSPSLDRSLNILQELGYTLAAVKQGTDLPEDAILIHKKESE